MLNIEICKIGLQRCESGITYLDLDVFYIFCSFALHDPSISHDDNMLRVYARVEECLYNK